MDMARRTIPRKIIGRKIKKIRLNLGLTQAQLSEKVGLSEKYISNIETGSGSCSLPALISIANGLNTSMDFLLSNVLNVNNQLQNTDKIYQLKNILDNMSDKQVDFIIQTAFMLNEFNLH